MYCVAGGDELVKFQVVKFDLGDAPSAGPEYAETTTNKIIKKDHK
jgi:hypothetical protein